MAENAVTENHASNELYRLTPSLTVGQDEMVQSMSYLLPDLAQQPLFAPIFLTSEHMREMVPFQLIGYIVADI
jgi:hypothetical protein